MEGDGKSRTHASDSTGRTLSLLAGLDASQESIISLSGRMERDADTPEKSSKFLKQMTYMCMAQIFGHRKLAPNNAFTKRKLGNGVPFMVFKKQDEAGLKCYNIVKHVMESIEKKYLRSFMIIIGAPNWALETYEIKLIYGDPDRFKISHDESIMDEIIYQGPETFQKEADNVLRNLVCTLAALAPLPQKVSLTLRVQYYEHAPPNYMTFPDTKSRLEVSKVHFAHETQETRVGRVDTCDAALAVKVQTAYMPADFSQLYNANVKTYLRCQQEISERQKRRFEESLRYDQTADEADQRDEDNASEADQRDVEDHREAKLLREDYQPDLLAVETEPADPKTRKSPLKFPCLFKDDIVEDVAEDALENDPSSHKDEIVQDVAEDALENEPSAHKNSAAVTKRRRMSFQTAADGSLEEGNSPPKRSRPSAKNQTDRTVGAHGKASFKLPEDDDLSDVPPPPAHSTPNQPKTKGRAARAAPKRQAKVPAKPQIKKAGKK